MKTLVIGASGYIGSVVAQTLAARGHEVVALNRSGEAAGPYETRTGDLTDPASLAAAAADVDAVVHLAPPLGDEQADAAAVAALLGRKVVYTSGVWVLGASDSTPLTETAPTNPLPIVGYRPRIEQQVLEAGGVVVRPGIAHGRGGGIPSMLVAWAKQDGAGRYAGAVSTGWPMVHVDDLAELFALAVESAEAGSVLHGVAEESVSTVALAAAADLAAGGEGRAEPWPAAAETVGEPFAEALALDQTVSSAATRKAVGWEPTHPTALADLTTGSY